MGGSSRCIGGISHDGRSIRLLNHHGANWDTSAPFQIGQIWDMAFTPAQTLVSPHTEDVLVTRYQFVGTQANLQAHLLTRGPPWQGSINQVFGGVLEFTSKNNGYVCRRHVVPAVSTWFWIPDRDLTLRADGKHYDYPNSFLRRGLAYVGEPQAVPSLPAGTLVRVSLARWWRPDETPDLEERCYLQLSGWF
ncbi:MAG TPA: hypothetical protein DDZ81_06405 [Acetobacteraceae bacterium]|jgi:hypothetical protein|nr:hypothetical protein [Acetobacteraceae bacterium]